MTLEVDGFSRQNLLKLIDGEILAIRIPQVATPSECHRFSKIYQKRFENKNSSVPEVVRFGVSQYEHGLRVSKNHYFRAAKESKVIQSQIFSNSFSPIERLKSVFRKDNLKLEIAMEPYFGEYYSGVYARHVGSAPIHVDWAPLDSQDWLVGNSQVKAQLAWNLYLEVPDEGGALNIWKKAWSRADDQFQDQESYFHDSKVVEGVPSIVIQPQVGDILIINSRYYHKVGECPKGQRATFGCFLTLTQNSEDTGYIWS